MNYISLFSGISADSVAWQPLGWTPLAFAEIEPFASAVLAHHHPDVPNLGDVTKITREQITAFGEIDLIVFGFPCQDMSVAGKRAGLTDGSGRTTRSGLFFDAMRIVNYAKPRWLVIENVPGLLSVNNGADMISVLNALSDAGYIFDVDCLDAQYFGVPQRRRRIFFVCESLAHGLRMRSDFFLRAAYLAIIDTLRLLLIAATDPLVRKRSDWAACASSDGIQKKRKFFDASPVPNLWLTLPSILDGTSALSLKNSPRWESTYEKDRNESGSMAVTMNCIKGTGNIGTPMNKANDNAFLSMSQLWKNIWAVESPSKKKSTTLTVSRATIESKIYTCAEICNTIGSYIAVLADCCPSWSPVALSASTVLREFTAYARSASDGLFIEMEWRDKWRIFLSKAEQSIDALIRLGNLGELERRESIENAAGLCGIPETILPQSESLPGNYQAVRAAGAGIAASLTRGAGSGGRGGYAGRRREDDVNIVVNTLDAHMGMGGPDVNAAQAGHLIESSTSWDGSDIAECLDSSKLGKQQAMPDKGRFAAVITRVGTLPSGGTPKGHGTAGVNDQAVDAGHVIAFDTTQITSGENYSNPRPGDPCHPLASGAHPPAIAFQERTRADGRSCETQSDLAYALTAPNGGGRRQEMNIASGKRVRQLTPREAEALMAFPRDYTLIPYRGKPAADGPRYRALGNSIVTTVLAWIGRRIEKADRETRGGRMTIIYMDCIIDVFAQDPYRASFQPCPGVRDTIGWITPTYHDLGTLIAEAMAEIATRIGQPASPDWTYRGVTVSHIGFVPARGYWATLTDLPDVFAVTPRKLVKACIEAIDNGYAAAVEKVCWYFGEGVEA